LTQIAGRASELDIDTDKDLQSGEIEAGVTGWENQPVLGRR
jgi:hypothetical protein